MNQRAHLGSVEIKSTHSRNTARSEGHSFEEILVQNVLNAALPEIKSLVRQLMEDEANLPLVLDYEEAGRMIGTSYEGIRKLVRNGKLVAVSRSGRHRGIAITELKDYVKRSQIRR